MSFSEEKRKKLIVPAVALMMCAVAMIGVGYAAFQSSVNTTNTIDTSEYLFIDVKKTNAFAESFEEGNVTNVFGGKAIRVSEKDDDSTTYKYYFNSTGYLKIFSNNTTNCTLSATCNITGLTVTVTNGNDITLTKTSDGSNALNFGTVKSGEVYTVTLSGEYDTTLPSNNFTLKFITEKV